MHVHVAVDDLSHSIGFYSALFAAKPAVVKTDYAKWMLDDPRVNFAISTRGRRAGLDHLGIQVEDKIELNEIYARLRKAGGDVVEQGQTSCCYAKSEKSWVDDPEQPQNLGHFYILINTAMLGSRSSASRIALPSAVTPGREVSRRPTALSESSSAPISPAPAAAAANGLLIT